MDGKSTAQGCEDLPDLPSHLLHPIFALAGAPLTTCKASAVIASDPRLSAAWLLVRYHLPLLAAARHKLWDACQHLLSDHQYQPDAIELPGSHCHCAEAGQLRLVTTLLGWCCNQPCSEEGCYRCKALDRGLLHAACANQLPVCSLLVEHPCITSEGIWQAIVAASESGAVDVLPLLLSRYPDAHINPFPTSGSRMMAPMTAAASQGHIEVMRVLCQHGASIHNSSDTPWAGHWSETPLEAAVNHQKAEAVVWLLEQGARPNDGLAQAASRGDVSTLQLLVRHEANVEAHGTRALHQAIDVGRASTAELLLELGAPSYLEAFCRKLCFCDVGTLLEWLSDSLDFVSSQDLRALHSTAVKYGHTEFARMLAAADRRLA